MAISAAARETVLSLRREIARIEGTLAERLEAPASPVRAAGPGVEPPAPEADAVLLRRSGRAVAPAMVSTGAAGLDAALGGGMPAAGLAELHGARGLDAGAVSGFALALAARAAAGRPVIWIATASMFREAGRPYLPGILGFCGIAPGLLLVAEAEKLADTLWIAEEAAGLAPLGAVLLEIAGNPRRLDLTATRRLHRRALAGGHALLLVRQGAVAEPTAAPLRLVVAPAPALSRMTLAGPLAGSIGPPCFRVAVDKSRLSRPAGFLVSWDPASRAFEEKDDVFSATHSRPVAAAAADGPHPAPPREILALRGHPGLAAGGQPPRGQRPAHRRA